LVGSARYILGPFSQDSDLRRHGLKVAERGGKYAKKRAMVARKLSELLQLLRVSGEVYDPLHNAGRSGELSYPSIGAVS
jgi:transposase